MNRNNYALNKVDNTSSNEDDDVAENYLKVIDKFIKKMGELQQNDRQIHQDTQLPKTEETVGLNYKKEDNDDKSGAFSISELSLELCDSDCQNQTESSMEDQLLSPFEKNESTAEQDACLWDPLEYLNYLLGDKKLTQVSSPPGFTNQDRKISQCGNSDDDQITELHRRVFVMKYLWADQQYNLTSTDPKSIWSFNPKAGTSYMRPELERLICGVTDQYKQEVQNAVYGMNPKELQSGTAEYFQAAQQYALSSYPKPATADNLLPRHNLWFKTASDSGVSSSAKKNYSPSLKKVNKEPTMSCNQTTVPAISEISMRRTTFFRSSTMKLRPVNNMSLCGTTFKSTDIANNAVPQGQMMPPPGFTCTHQM